MINGNMNVIIKMGYEFQAMGFFSWDHQSSLRIFVGTGNLKKEMSMINGHMNYQWEYIYIYIT